MSVRIDPICIGNMWISQLLSNILIKCGNFLERFSVSKNIHFMIYLGRRSWTKTKITIFFCASFGCRHPCLKGIYVQPVRKLCMECILNHMVYQKMDQIMPFLAVVRCHASCWKGDANFRSQFSLFDLLFFSIR